MISKFFTIQHTAEAKKILNLRAAQLVNIFLKESADKDLKNRIHALCVNLSMSQLILR